MDTHLQLKIRRSKETRQDQMTQDEKREKSWRQTKSKEMTRPGLTAGEQQRMSTAIVGDTVVHTRSFKNVRIFTYM